ncbi:unnamed protein product [Periconia digitata]|uniref:AB hydrolase-1 domain-containing protein n=1 Tax=Periconia digitata TaxID=1303443 RepID=A0A9W4UDW7_9PLEO|nr:unnamed protein product [Periconia digitata]
MSEALETTLLLIPGAWHLPSCYETLITHLKTTHNLSSTTITFPTTSGDPNATFSDDYNTARTTLISLLASPKNVVVIAHSYGGMVASSAIKNLTSSPSSSSSSNDPQNPKGSVTGLILITSGFTLTGLTFMDHTFNIPPPAWRPNPQTGFADLALPPTHLFYHDVPPVDAARAVAQLRPQSLKALYEGRDVAYAGWRDVPWCLYVGASDDRALPVFVQRFSVGFARGVLGRAGRGRIAHVEMETSHSPFLSQAEVLACVVAKAVEAGGKEVEWDGEKGVSVPRVRLGMVAGWWRFGVPLVLGYLIGKVVVVCQWFRRVFWG